MLSGKCILPLRFLASISIPKSTLLLAECPSGSFILIRKNGNAQIFVGRRDIGTEVLCMPYALGMLNSFKNNPPSSYLLLRRRCSIPNPSRKPVTVNTEQR